MKSADWVRSLVGETPVILPSLLAADFANLVSEVRRLEAAGAKVLHIDVMDGHFVPNISIGVPVVESLRKITNLKLDVHLMITNPEKFIVPFQKAGADSILFHVEVVPEPRDLLRKIRDLGVAPGLVSNPTTPVEKLLPWVDDADIILTMSVQPGFGGQKLNPEVFDKIRTLRKHIRPDTLLSIDGGVNEKTIAACAQAGVQLFVAGTGVFDADDYTQRMADLKKLATREPHHQHSDDVLFNTLPAGIS
ncbi:MAG: ribulose-phosphate 3-epimerase [Planctomycetia bacterium]|nr:ribulose-phosphate 3-epimerase [Planctomycetia bacterium]